MSERLAIASPLLRALAFAAARHRDQRRKDAVASPYINHPIALAELLANEAGVDDEQVLMAAILHDTVEDTETTQEEIAGLFGDDIASVVAEVTDDKRLPKDARKRLQIEHAPTLGRSARLVKLADKICNLRDIISSPPDDWDIERRRAYFVWAQAVVAGLRGTHPRLESLFDEVCTRSP
jgi:GTP diphosphokinase / guanosine-3',5'-bis(diphosphate) 3'-diphosphatase